MKPYEFSRLAPALRTRAITIGLSFFEQQEAAEDVAQEALIRLWKAWDTLPRTEARLWRMFAEAGMKAGEISLITDINVRSVSSMLSHARKHIFKILKEGGYIDE